jgi:hypothetical protein
MLDKRILLISAATAACALGIGFLMQPSTYGPAGAGGGAVQAGPDLPQEPALAQPISIEKITLTSAEPPSSQTGQVAARPAGTEAVIDAERQAPEATCTMDVQAEALPGALVALHIAAPCQGAARITLHHQGMMVTETLDSTGQLDLVVPALSSSATFIVESAAFGETAAILGAVARVAVPEMAEVDRVVLQWSGNSGFEIHAREFGAQYGENGHVWHGADLAQHSVGQLLQLGDASQLAPRLAEVYSFPRNGVAALAEAGVVEISVEAEITQINCGREISAQSLRMVAGRVQTRDLVLNMPDCSASGDFLVLNNLVENLKIAAK